MAYSKKICLYTPLCHHLNHLPMPSYPCLSPVRNLFFVLTFNYHPIFLPCALLCNDLLVSPSGLYLWGHACSCLFDLVHPWFMPICPYLHLLSLMCSQFVLVQPLLVCWFVLWGGAHSCSFNLLCPWFVPIHPCLCLFSLVYCQFMLV